MADTLKSKAAKGVLWSAVDRFSSQGITFVLGLIMARLLSPSDYGTIGMLSIFMALSQTFIDSGFSNALIRKLDRTDTDFCTVFYFNLAVSVLCYAVLFVSAPFVADFFKYPLLTDVLRVVALQLCISALNSVQNAKFVIAVDFKTLAKCSLTSTVLSGLVGIALAYRGYGVWALVYQQISASIILTATTWWYSRWLPKWRYSWQSFRELFAYGSKLLFAGLLHTFYSNMSALSIGKFYTPKDLGYYSRGESLATLPCSNITGVLQRVTFPVFANLQNDDDRLISVYRKYIRTTSLVVFFVMVLLAALAKPLVLLLLTAKWEHAGVYAQILCFAWMFDHICAMNLNILQVKGRSDLFLRLEIIKKTISLSILFAAIPFGVMAICLSRIVYTQVALIINTYYTGKMFDVGYLAQCRDFGKYWVFAVLAALPAYLLSLWAVLPPWLTLLAGSLTATVLYVALLRAGRDACFAELWTLARQRLFKKA